VCATTTAERAQRPVSASIATARALLAGGADINAVHHIPDSGEHFPASPLWHAIARGRNRSLARYLLREGADPNYCLWAVVWNDDIVTARLLHDHHANLDLTFHAETPLLYATRLRRPRMARWLLAHGANPNIGDANGVTPLAVAVKRRHSLGEIEELLAHGANQHVADRDGRCPRSLAAPSASRLRQLLDRFAESPAPGP
jgi:ankyrin repeat protein